MRVRRVLDCLGACRLGAVAGVDGVRKVGHGTVNTSSAGAEANANAQAGSISADGRYVVFESQASNLVANDTNPNFS